MKFNYQAKTKDGELAAGVIDASSREAAVSLLAERELLATFLEEEKKAFYEKDLPFTRRISIKDVVGFSRELSVMLKSKVPVVEVLETLAGEMENKAFKEKIMAIAEDVEGGQPLSQAFAKHQDVFSPFFVSMIKSGESLGRMSDAFSYLAEHIEREYTFMAKIKGAMVYPIFVLVVLAAVLILMMNFVIPQLTGVLKESGQAIPLITRIVIAASEFTRKWGWLVGLALAVAAFLGWRYSKSKEGKKFFDKVKLKIPFLNGFLKKIYLARLSSNLSTLISGGIPISAALEITAEVMGNEEYKNIVSSARDEVKRGEPISSVFKQYPELVTPLFTQMVSVGEKTGTLDETLMNIVSFYQKEVDRSLESFISILEPLMIVVLGLIVAGIMGAVLLPVYQSYSV